MTAAKLQQMGAEQGVQAGDVKRMFSAGLTEGMVAQAAGYGVSFPDLFKLFQQFGPTLLPILATLFGMFKTPAPTPAPQPQPTDEENK